MRAYSLVSLLVAGILAFAPATTRAGFESGVVNIHPTTSHIPRLGACPDGAHGAVVAWQENSVPPAGTLRALHLLASGSADPGWSPDGVVLGTVQSECSALGTVADGSGGAYVWWIEAGILSMTRVTSSGARAAGWPDAGRSLGRLNSRDRPEVFPDGSGGVYAGWWDIGLVSGQRQRPLAFHLGGTGHGTGGWPDAPLAFESAFEERLNLLPAFALAAEGGLWAAWLSLVVDPVSYVATGGYRVSHVRPSGAASPGWSRGGTEFVPIVGEIAHLGGSRMRPLAIADAGDGGFFLMTWDDASALELSMDAPITLRRFSVDGSVAPGWSENGVQQWGNFVASADPGASPHVMRAASGALVTGVAGFGVESSEGYALVRRAADGTSLGTALMERKAQGLKLRLSPDGDIATAWAVPYGTPGYMTRPVASISGVFVAPGGAVASFEEYQPGYWTVWYGDADIVPTSDGAAIFIWSQDLGRVGLQAMRLAPGNPLSVPPAPAPGAPLLRVRFVRGEGVHAVASIAGSPRVTLALYDLLGRRVSAVESDGTLGADVVLPRTRDLAGGVYFARASDGTNELRARVIVFP